MGLGPLVETKRLEIQIEQLEAKLAKAEAERDEARDEIKRLKGELALANKTIERCLGDPNLSADLRLKQERDSERARAEKYLKAMEPVAYLESVVWCDIDLDRCRIEMRWSERQTIRALVEEARRAE